MIVVDNIFVPRVLLTARFCCPYETCGSKCCVNGDNGAPVKEEEILRMEEHLESVIPDLDPVCVEWIRKDGILQTDSDGLNLSCLNGTERCVFSVQEEKGVSCRLETYSREKGLDTLRPVSCRLFPIRTRRYNGLDILDYEVWDECQAAWDTGGYLLDFCRDALEDSFGEEWFLRLLKARQAANDSLNPRSKES